MSMMLRALAVAVLALGIVSTLPAMAQDGLHPHRQTYNTNSSAAGMPKKGNKVLTGRHAEILRRNGENITAAQEAAVKLYRVTYSSW